ncbi:enoyl-CoA hydratase-related protein [Aquabacter sp. CN5-332]|uniref:enoyl-CoA hydratase-related protein n=1 Tax=Aquabacter sp. CN5-332 TaxID=3156608 RepID=UPI0032B432FE
MSQYTFDTLAVELAEGIARVTLNRPEKRNAMNPRMHEEMHRLLAGLNADPEVHVIVITGAGKSFCAGADIKEFFNDLEGQPEARAVIMEVARQWMWEGIAGSPKATIAMINGHCFGGGLLVALACDIAVAGSAALFGLPEINWGHVPGGAASKKTIEAMGARQALYYALTGENFDAETAARTGLITKTVSQERLAEEVDALAKTLAAKSPFAVRTVKEIYRAAPDLDMTILHDFVAAKIDQLRIRDTAGNRSKGMQDFIGKRLRTTAPMGEQ